MRSHVAVAFVVALAACKEIVSVSDMELSPAELRVAAESVSAQRPTPTEGSLKLDRSVATKSGRMVEYTINPSLGLAVLQFSNKSNRVLAYGSHFVLDDNGRRVAHLVPAPHFAPEPEGFRIEIRVNGSILGSLPSGTVFSQMQWTGDVLIVDCRESNLARRLRFDATHIKSPAPYYWDPDFEGFAFTNSDAHTELGLSETAP